MTWNVSISNLKQRIELERERRRRASERDQRDMALWSALWQPQEGPQSDAFYCEADQVGYGGAAGGGKTDLALGLAIRRHRRSIIFRRAFPNARGVIERSRELLYGHARFNEQNHLWRLGARHTIEIGSMVDENDKFNHQGQARDLHIFDEATEFSESQVRFVTGWNRSADPSQHCQILLTFNPPMDDTASWVVRYFAPWLDTDYIDKAADGEIRYVARIDDQDVFYADYEDIPEESRESVKTRTFFHASLKDNPILASTGYGATIEAMPEPLRSILKGNFNVAAIADPWQVIPTAWIKAAQARWQAQQPDDSLLSVGVDVARGGKDKTVIAKLYGAWFAPLEKYPGASTPDGPTVAALVLPYANALRGLSVDVIGVGSAVYDALKGTVRVAGVNFAEGTPLERDKTGRLKFRNVRACAYWRLREALDPNTGDNLALPPDPELESDLKAPKWSLTTGGILIESKEDIKERIGRSPDAGDAVVLAYYGVKQRTNSAVGMFAR